jgi:hypothetical protein
VNQNYRLSFHHKVNCTTICFLLVMLATKTQYTWNTNTQGSTHGTDTGCKSDIYTPKFLNSSCHCAFHTRHPFPPKVNHGWRYYCSSYTKSCNACNNSSSLFILSWRTRMWYLWGTDLGVLETGNWENYTYLSVHGIWQASTTKTRDQQTAAYVLQLPFIADTSGP